MTARPATGSARSPNAGTRTTIGSARAQANPSEAEIDPGPREGALNFGEDRPGHRAGDATRAPRGKEARHAVRPVHRRKNKRARSSLVHVEGHRPLRARRRREAPGARLPVRGARPQGAPELRGGSVVPAAVRHAGEDRRRLRERRARRAEGDAPQAVRAAGDALDHGAREGALRPAQVRHRPRRDGDEGREGGACRRHDVDDHLPRRRRVRRGAAASRARRGARHRAAEGQAGRFPRRGDHLQGAGAPLPPLGRPQPAARRSGVRRERRVPAGAHPSRALHLRVHGPPRRAGGVRRRRAKADRIRGLVQEARVARRHARDRGVGRRARQDRAHDEREGAV